MKIFPDFEMKVTPSLDTETGIDGLDVDIQTYIRKKHNKKWYILLVRCKNRVSYDPDVLVATRTWYSEIIKTFYTACYRAIIYSNVKGMLELNKQGEGKWHIDIRLDTDQRSEEDRLNNIIRYNKIKFV